MDSTLSTDAEEWARLVEMSGAFDFWHDPAEDLYNKDDGEPV